jgi:uncharacterized cupredoxin-like copper-binding protein
MNQAREMRAPDVESGYSDTLIEVRQMRVRSLATSWFRRSTGLLLGAAAVALTAAACGGSSGGSSSNTPSSSSSAAKGTTVAVTETEFKIALDKTTFAPGTYSFVVDDKGKATHALTIEGPGLGEKSSKTLSAGQSTTLTVTLKKGTYELYCPIDGHKQNGMKTHITVG